MLSGFVGFWASSRGSGNIGRPNEDIYPPFLSTWPWLVYQITVYAYLWAMSREAKRRICDGAGSSGNSWARRRGWFRVTKCSLRASGSCQERKTEWQGGDSKDKGVCLETPEGNLGAPRSSGEGWESSPGLWCLSLFCCLFPRISKGSRLCLFVVNSTAIHRQIDRNVCQPFLFKNMNYSRNITKLIRNH